MYEFMKNFNDGIDNFLLEARDFFNSPFMHELGDFIGAMFFFLVIFLLVSFVLFLIISGIVLSIKDSIEGKKIAKIEEEEKMAEKLKSLEDSLVYNSKKVKVVKK